MVCITNKQVYLTRINYGCAISIPTGSFPIENLSCVSYVGGGRDAKEKKEEEITCGAFISNVDVAITIKY